MEKTKLGFTERKASTDSNNNNNGENFPSTEKRVSAKKEFVDDLIEKIEKQQPGLGALIQKEKPLIQELMKKLREREITRERGTSFTAFSEGSFSDSISAETPGDSVMSQSSLDSSAPFSPKRYRHKSPLEKLIQDEDIKQQFKQFLETKGGFATHNFQFWQDCTECEQRARGCTKLAKKIVTKIIKDSQSLENPQNSSSEEAKSKLQLALHSAVVAVRYELLKHKDSTLETARSIADKYLREDSKEKVDLSEEKKSKIIYAVDSPENVPEEELLSSILEAQNETIELLQTKYYEEFNQKL